MDYKRTLIISANPVSKIYNNGKTLSAFFDQYPKEKVRQLYFSASLPDSDICSAYFRISDVDILNRRLKRSSACGKSVCAVAGVPTQTLDEQMVQKVKKGNFFRLLREIMWNREWKTKELLEWLDDFSPEVIFFLAGDGGFSYQIYSFIVKRYNAKTAIYITDDYILPRANFDLWGYIRRKIIRNYMKTAVSGANVLFTISAPMRECYRKIFGKDSFVIANMYEPKKLYSGDKKERDDIVITYAGGLHYNRSDTIARLVQVISEINTKYADGGKRVRLYIYSGSELNKRFEKKILESKCCVWGGLLNSAELEKQLNASDFLLHVESFRKKDICNTRLSLSTKIPEYMSYKKPIIAIGPAEVASMMYLEKCACCITDLNQIQEKLETTLFDEQKRTFLADKAYQQYLNNHEKKRVQPRIVDILNRL